MVFLFGGFVAGIGGYGGVVHWLIAAIDLVCIEPIMLGSVRRPEI